MKPPSKVKIGSKTYSLHVDKNMISAEVAENPDNGGLLGYCKTYHQVIAISPDQAPDTMRGTILHEVLHAVWDQTGLDSEPQEQVIRCLEAPLLQTLRENPRLLAYLTEEAR